MLHTASFYAPKHWVGRLYRVSRHHPRGRRTQWETMPLLYPSAALLRAYRAGELDFEAFGIEYRCGLDAALVVNPELQEWLAGVPALGDFTLLCFEAAGLPCHRRVLAQWLLSRAPGLEVGELR
jgi:uncharacterized protein YeaO (DUF488 family)